MIEPELIAAVGPVLDALRALGVRHFVGGSIASSAHGAPRSSIDADLVAELAPEHAERFAAALRGAYYVPESRMREAIAARSSFNVIHLGTMFKVDVFVAKDRPFDRRALDRARSAALDPAGQRLAAVATAEDIVLAKLEWYRRGGEVSDRQWTDVIGVLKAQAAVLDLPYVESGARELGISDLLARVLEEAGLAPGSGR